LNIYDGWWQVPDYMLSATQLGELEFPRVPTESPSAWVNSRDWAGRKVEFPLYNSRLCPPTKATAGMIAATAARSHSVRVCTDCGARCQRILSGKVGGRPLCPACQSVVRLRQEQTKASADRAEAIIKCREMLARPGTAVVQVQTINPGLTRAGTARPNTAVQVSAVDTTGKPLLGVLVSLVGPRARIREPEAIAREEGVPMVHSVLLDRPMVAWDLGEVRTLVEEFSHPSWPRHSWGIWDFERATQVKGFSTAWRGQVDTNRRLIDSLPPGTPDRLLLHLQRIAADQTEGDHLA